MSKRTGIHVHGRHLQAVGAEQIMWGEAPNALGQLTTALLVLLGLPDPPVILSIGTGASKKDGLLEAEFWGKYLLENLNRLPEIKPFQQADVERLRSLLGRIMYLEMTSQNTFEEAQVIARLYREREIDEMIVVSAPTHLSRCMLDVLRVLQAPEYERLRRNVQFRASEVPYSGYGLGDVVVVEPPHRGDDTSPPFFRLVRRMFRVAAEKKKALYESLDRILEEFGA